MIPFARRKGLPCIMTREEEYKTILARYLPLTAVEPIYKFVSENGVRFKIAPSRTSKLGDYRRPTPQHPYHEISVNGDLPKYFFLMVLLHEMAHLKTNQAFGRGVQPHGHEWQAQYRNLLVEYFNAGHFPADTYPLFKKYTSHIPLNRAAGDALEQAMKRYGLPEDDVSHITLSELPLGSSFRLKNKPDRLFTVIEKRRTRFLCEEMRNHQRYLVSGAAEVINITT